VACRQGNYEETRTLHEQGLRTFRELADKPGTARSLGGFAELAWKQGALKRAVHLWGAAEALRENIETPASPEDRTEYERDIVAAHAQLNEATWQAGWAEGRAMTMEQAIAYALEESEGEKRGS
jgi:hypothetical protein